MMDLRRLPISRQRAAGEGLRHRLGELTPQERENLDADVMSSANRVLELTSTLSEPTGVPKLAVDNAADQITAAFHTILGAVANGLNDTIVPLNDDARAHKAAAQTVITRAFGLGTSFLRQDMTLEYVALRQLVTTLEEPDVNEAVNALGLGYFVTHIAAHLGPYGVAAGSVGLSTMEKASDAWHEAFEYLVIDARKAYRNDPERRTLFLADYEKELAAHIADQQAARRARNKETDVG